MGPGRGTGATSRDRNFSCLTTVWWRHHIGAETLRYHAREKARVRLGSDTAVTWVWMGCTREPKLHTHTPKFILEEKNLYYKTYISWWEKVVKVWRRFNFGWSISFKKTQKQSCSELNCLRMIPLCWHFKGRWRQTQNIKQICPRKIDKILTFLLPGRKTTQLYKWIWPKHRQNWVSYELTKEN